jgi:uncharacterized membrane protein YbhN (UPF0104 family)
VSPRRVAWIAAIAIFIYSVAGYWVLTNFDIPPVRGWVWLFIIAAGVSQIGAMWFFGLLFRASLRQVGREIAPFSGFKAALVGAGVARLIPVGGAITPVAMAWTVREETQRAGGPALRTVLLNYAGLLVLAGGGILISRPSGPAQVFGIGLTVVAPFTLLAGLLLMFGSGRLASINRRLPAFIRDRLKDSMSNHTPTLESQAFIWGRLFLEVSALWLVLHGFGIDIGILETIAVFAISSLFGGLPGTPGGLGITEIGLALMLGAYGWPAAVTAVPILVYRVISYWLPAATGFLAGGTTFLASEEAKAVETSA